MSSAVRSLPALLVPPALPPHQGRRHLHGPILDFLCLGGVSLLVLPLALLVPNGAAPAVVVPMVLVVSLVNFPHFAHSYQIFYRHFRAKAGRSNPDRDLRGRYLLAGVVAPVSIAAALAGAAALGDLRLLGLFANAMGFLVGWHYVKQGYGILMVDAAFKRRFFAPHEKRVLLLNAYIVWMAAWITGNVVLGHSELWGITSFLIAFPRPFVWASWAAVAGSAVATLWMLAACHRAGRQPPVTGLVAYGTSLYLWQLFVVLSPMWLLIVPVMHSLQYLTVVWRFELNRAKAAPDAAVPADGVILRTLLPLRYQRRMSGFVLMGIVSGVLVFWAVPLLLEALVAHPNTAGLIFLFSVWVFVNVHHYFIDNVIWRSQNPEARTYLFA